MASRLGSRLANVLKSQDLSIALEIPLAGPSDSSSFSLSISVGPVSIPLKTSEPQPNILPPSPSDLAEIGNSDSLPTILGQET